MHKYSQTFKNVEHIYRLKETLEPTSFITKCQKDDFGDFYLRRSYLKENREIIGYII